MGWNAISNHGLGQWVFGAVTVDPINFIEGLLVEQGEGFTGNNARIANDIENCKSGTLAGEIKRNVGTSTNMEFLVVVELDAFELVFFFFWLQG